MCGLPQKAGTKARTSRRALFGSAALLATHPAAPEPRDLDRELIEACSEFIAAHQAYFAACEATERDAELGAASDAWCQARATPMARMEALHAATAEGVRARALALREFMGDDPDVSSGDMSGRLLSWLLRDAAALGGAA